MAKIGTVVGGHSSLYVSGSAEQFVSQCLQCMVPSRSLIVEQTTLNALIAFFFQRPPGSFNGSIPGAICLILDMPAKSRPPV